MGACPRDETSPNWSQMFIGKKASFNSHLFFQCQLSMYCTFYPNWYYYMYICTYKFRQEKQVKSNIQRMWINVASHDQHEYWDMVYFDPVAYSALSIRLIEQGFVFFFTYPVYLWSLLRFHQTNTFFIQYFRWKYILHCDFFLIRSSLHGFSFLDFEMHAINSFHRPTHVIQMSFNSKTIVVSIKGRQWKVYQCNFQCMRAVVIKLQLT